MMHLDSFCVSLLNGAFLITSNSLFTTLLLLPVDAAKMDGWLTVTFSLNFKTLVADSDIKPIPFIGSILNDCPLFPPDINVLSLVVFSIFLLAETL